MTLITLTVPKASPSLNNVTGQHWSIYWRAKRQWLRLIWVAKIEAQCFGDPMIERSRITIERRGVNLLDTDNCIGGVKPLVDCLKLLRIIADDSPAHVALTVTQERGLPERTVIRIEALSPVMEQSEVTAEHP